MLRFQNGITLNNRFYLLDVEILNFLSHGLGSDKIKDLVEAISPYNKIKILNLGENDITDDVIPTICKHLLSEQNSTLEQLDLGGNLITEKGARLLLQTLLSSNNRLIELQLAGNNKISESTLKTIQEILNKNKSCRLENQNLKMNTRY